jgi:hypothetical protein
MSRSSLYLRRGFLGLAFVSALGLITTQVSAQPWYQTCPARGYDYPDVLCAYGCDVGRGYCTASGYCACGDLP